MKLTEPMVRALRALADGPKRSSNRTSERSVRGHDAVALIYLGLAERTVGSNFNIVRITPAGRAWLAANTERTSDGE